MISWDRRLRFVTAMHAFRIERGWTEAEFALHVGVATGLNLNRRQIIQWEMALDPQQYRAAAPMHNAQCLLIAGFFGLTAKEMCDMGEPTNPELADYKRPISFVYFIAAEGTEFVKIGTARNVQARLWRLQTGSPYPLVVLAVMPGRVATEHRLHRRFSESRTTGEWFRRTPELDALIASLSEPRHAA